MDRRISFVTLGVDDLARARLFYEQGLGWKPTPIGAEGVAFYQAAGIVVALYPRASLAKELGIEVVRGSPGIVLSHNVTNGREVELVLARAQAAGATILRPGGPMAWGGYAGFFADPEGHVWEIAWNAKAVIGMDGSTRLLP